MTDESGVATLRKKVDKFLTHTLGLGVMCPSCGETARYSEQDGMWVCEFCMNQFEEP